MYMYVLSKLYHSFRWHVVLISLLISLINENGECWPTPAQLSGPAFASFISRECPVFKSFCPRSCLCHSLCDLFVFFFFFLTFVSRSTTTSEPRPCRLGTLAKHEEHKMATTSEYELAWRHRRMSGRRNKMRRASRNSVVFCSLCASCQNCKSC